MHVKYASERKSDWSVSSYSPRAWGAGGGWRGGAHVVCGLKIGALGDEVLEAVELAEDNRMHEGRDAVLREGDPPPLLRPREPPPLDAGRAQAARQVGPAYLICAALQPPCAAWARVLRL